MTVAMADHRFCWVLVAVLIVAACREVKSDEDDDEEDDDPCTGDAVKACYSLWPFDRSIPTENLTREDFRSRCGHNVTAFKQCVDDLKCTPADGPQLYNKYYLNFQDTADGYIYLCEPSTQRAFFANTDCLRLGFQHHQGVCATSVTAARNDKDKCRYIYDRAECAYNWTMAECNNERVAELVQNVIIKAHHRQYIGQYDCRISRCEESTLDECSTYARLKADIHAEPPKLIYDTKQKLDDVCSNLDELEDCVTEAKCGGYEEGKIDRYIRGFTYLCSHNDTKQVYMDNIGCYTGQETKENVSSCEETIKNYTGFFFPKCMNHRRLNKCRRDAYTASCGADAADVIISLQDRLEDCPCRKHGLSDGGTQTVDFYRGSFTVLVATVFSLMINIFRL